MPRTDEAAAFFHAVYSAIQEIPYGKVTSYGHIAMLIGTRESPVSICSPFHAVSMYHTSPPRSRCGLKSCLES